MSENSSAKSTTNKKRLFLIGGLGAIIISVILYFWISAMGHETTDNAQIDALITPVKGIVAGFITQVNFEDNQIVKLGDTLIVIDNKDYLAKVAQAEAALESAKAQLEVSHSGASSAQSTATASNLNTLAAKANIDAAQARCTKNEKELARINSLIKDGAATTQQLESIKAEYDASKAQLEMLTKQAEAAGSQAVGAQSSVQGQQAQINLALALVKQREAELLLAQNQLANTIIKAPFDGVISKKSVEVGQYLTTGAPIAATVDYTHLFVSANFKETQLQDMRTDQLVDIKLDAFPAVKISGKLQSFGGATGAKFSLLPPDNSTGNFVKVTQRVPVRILITSYPEAMKKMLIPGLSAYVDVHTK
jgi:membrane fusion protein (multidrug efflux system)